MACSGIFSRPSKPDVDPIRESVSRLREVAFELGVDRVAYHFADCDGSFDAIIGRILKKVNGGG